eukprot:3664686-Rhodomonas_salina.2
MDAAVEGALVNAHAARSLPVARVEVTLGRACAGSLCSQVCGLPVSLRRGQAVSARDAVSA